MTAKKPKRQRTKLERLADEYREANRSRRRQAVSGTDADWNMALVRFDNAVLALLAHAADERRR